MGSVIKWALILLVIVVVGGFIYFGLSEEPVERSVVEQPVDRDTLGI